MLAAAPAAASKRKAEPFGVLPCLHSLSGALLFLESPDSCHAHEAEAEEEEGDRLGNCSRAEQGYVGNRTPGAEPEII